MNFKILKGKLLTLNWDPRIFYVDRKNNLIYLNNAKGGCSSILKVLNKNRNDFKYFLSKEETNFFKFTFVRNPFDRLVSCYEDKINNYNLDNKQFLYNKYFFFLPGTLIFYPGMSFEKFVSRVCKIPDFMSERHFKSQYSNIYLQRNCLVDYVGKLENFNSDFKTIQNKYDLQKLAHENKSRRNKDWRGYYSSQLAELVYRRYKKDFDIWYPNEYEKLLSHIEKNERN